jgi:Predicted membrane protein (DUF2079)
MSELAAAALNTAAVPHTRALALDRVRRIGYALLGLQLIAFLAWSTVIYNHYALTWDFSFYNQAWYLIAHGNLNPWDTTQGIWFWQNHCELIIWLLAPLYWIGPHDLMLVWIQDSAAAGAAAVAFTWICEIAGRRRADGHAAWFAVAGLVLLMADPWTWASLSWDYHGEPLGVLVVLLLSRDLFNGRRRAWVWAAILLLCGDVAASYLVGAGLGGALASRQSRWRGLSMAGVGALALVVITLVHGNIGSGHGLGKYAYLAGVPAGTSLPMSRLLIGAITHPLIALKALFSKAPNIWANLASPGLLGVGFIPILPLVIVALLAANLWPGDLFSAPGFQNIPLYFLVPVGTVAVLAALRQRLRITTLALSCVVVAQALAWAAVWGPQVSVRWLRVPAATAATLAATQALIPPGAEVIASQGVSGRFAGRALSFPIMSPGQLPVHGQTWFVIAPTTGIETEAPASAMALIGELAGPLGATLVTAANGVWTFRWNPPAGTTTITIPGNSAPIEAWVSPGAAGRSVRIGPVSDWHAAATGGDGYVADQLAWQVPTGRYMAEVTLATSGPVNVEVWDDTGNALLARRTVTASGGPEQVMLPFDARIGYRAGDFPGWGPFHADLVPPPTGQRLEVRVWSPGGTMVNVYSAELNAVLPRRPHAEAGHQEPARADRLVNGDVVSPGPGSGRGSGDDDSGKRRAGRLAATDPQRYVQGAVVAGQCAAPDRPGRRDRHRGCQGSPPGPVAFFRAADDPEVRLERGELRGERGAALPPAR